MAKKAIGEVRQNLEKYLKLMLAGALPMAVGGMILSAKLIGLVAGPGYAQAAPVLAILIWAPAILFVYIPLNSLVISQLTKKAVLITGINVIVNTVGNLILIPRFGIRASAIMTVVSESLQGAFYFYFVKIGITDFKFWSVAFKPLLGAAIMGAVLWPIRGQNLLISLPVGAVVYFITLILTGFIKKDDIGLARSLFTNKASTS
jgi:O-antigen/teichoic acid export membrane protein